MKIGIFGTGNMGSGLARLWAKRGHEVMLGSREPRRAHELAASLGGTSGSVEAAARFGDVLLLAVPWRGVRETLATAGALEGKVLLDCTNPLSPDYMELLIGHQDSGAEMIARWAPGARVVKAFNHIYAQIIHTSPRLGEHDASVFYCGDDASAKKAAAELISGIGFDPVDAGPLKNARFLEPMAELCVQLAYGLGQGTDQAFKLVHR